MKKINIELPTGIVRFINEIEELDLAEFLREAIINRVYTDVEDMPEARVKLIEKYGLKPIFEQRNYSLRFLEMDTE